MQVMNFAHCFHIELVIGKYTDVFGGNFSSGGQGERVTWEYLSMEEFYMGRRIFHEGGPGFPASFKK